MNVTLLLLHTFAGAGGGYLGDIVKETKIGAPYNIIAGMIGGNAVPAGLLVLGFLLNSDGSYNFVSGTIAALIGGIAVSLLSSMIKKD
jgi:uncharacterized membrane protein YeaQ/YmgE (transglycosylase-associated protein family)